MTCPDINLTIDEVGDDVSLTINEVGDDITLSFTENVFGTTFLNLADTPANYTGKENLFVRVNSTGDGIEFAGESTSTVEWGNVLGTLSNQTDLQEALDLKYDSLDFNTDWDTRLATKDTDDLTEGSTNLYDQTVVLTEGSNVTITGTYPNFTIASSDSDTTDHTDLTNIGTNTHAQIDAAITTSTNHIANSANPHSTTATHVGLGNVDNTSDADKPVSTLQQAEIDTKQDDIITTEGDVIIGNGSGDAARLPIGASGKVLKSDGSTLSWEDDATVSDHTLLSNIGTNTHEQLDTHLADGTIHFTEGSIDHTAITNIGTNTHAQIDTHIDDSTVHFTENSIDHSNIQNLSWSVAGHIIDTDLDMNDNAITELDHIDWDLTESHSPVEGRQSWDSEAGTVSIGMPGGNVNLQVGQENLIRVKATEAGLDGQVCYIDGADGLNPTISLAKADTELEAHKTLAVLTEDIAQNQLGYVNTFGLVRGVDTSSFNNGDIAYLSADTAGAITSVEPKAPNYSVEVGYVLNAHATEGTLLVNIHPDIWKNTFQTVNDPTGFDRTDTNALGEISFIDGTRTFTHSLVSGQTEMSYWVNGDKVVLNSNQSVQISDTEGIHFIYYDSGSLVESLVPWDFDSGKVFVAIVYWDATNGKGRIGEERHGISMDWATHQYLHNSVGAAYKSGFTPSLTVDGGGASDADCEMQSISAGVFYDEDIVNSNGEQTTYEIWYKDGANGDWRWETASSALVSMGATYPYYNEFTGGVWTRTENTNTNFMLMHIFATNRDTANEKIILVMGEDNYLSKSAAQDGALVEINNLTTGSLPTPEFVEIGTVIIESKLAFGNTYNSQVVSTSDGGDFVDFRYNDKIGVGASATNHGNLTGLTEDDHPQYVKYSGATGDVDLGTYNLTVGSGADDGAVYLGTNGQVEGTLNSDAEHSISLTSIQSVDVQLGESGFFNVYDKDGLPVFYVSEETGEADISGTLFMNQNNIFGVKSPTSDSHAANKEYVDLADLKYEDFTLDATDISNKYVTIVGTISDNQSTFLFLENIGIKAELAIDYSISGNQLYWTGYELDNTLEVGDKLRVYYI